MSSLGTDMAVERSRRRGWFAETLVVLGILAFAYFAATLQSSEPARPAGALESLNLG